MDECGIASHACRIRLVGKRIKAYNKTLYYLTKYLLIGALLYAIFA